MPAGRRGQKMDTSRRLSVGQTSVSQEPQTQGECAPLPELASTGDWREPARQQRWGLAAPWGPAGTPVPSLDPKSKAKGLKPLGEGQDPPFLRLQQKPYCPASWGGRESSWHKATGKDTVLLGEGTSTACQP